MKSLRNRFFVIAALPAILAALNGVLRPNEPCQAAVVQMSVQSNAFNANQYIPAKFTADGADASPALRWTGSPRGARSFCLICHDPDAPNNNWVHWVAYDIPPDMNSLVEGASVNAKAFRQGINSFNKVGWNGPAPPPGKPHRYIFDVYALDTLLSDLAQPKDIDLKKRVSGHVLATGQLVGLYKR